MPATNLFSDIPLLAAEAGRYGWQDIRTMPVAMDAPPPDAAALLRAFSQAMPPWANTLMRLRDRLVAPLGLKTAQTALNAAAGPYRQGQKLGVFCILHLGEHDVVLGEDDRHLDFRLVLRWRPGQLCVATLVRRHNALGRGYLALVTPFHHLIAGASARRMARALGGREA
ncbi:DUF2867 domain-containing protein [Chromobacterium alticapitis]|nr:DUF2867 domain-containing protein [Chromobacterium alticapitis]